MTKNKAKIVLTHHLDGETCDVLAEDLSSATEVMTFIDCWKNGLAQSDPLIMKIEPYNRIIKKDDSTFLIDFGDYSYFLRVEQSPNLMY